MNQEGPVEEALDRELKRLLYDPADPEASLTPDDFKAAVERGFQKALRLYREGLILASVPGDVALVFPGQGSQQVGFGRELYDRFKLVRSLFRLADEALDIPLTRVCLQGPEEELRRPSYARPAVVTVSVAVFLALKELQPSIIERAKFVAGHSIGEYSACVASGAIAALDAIRLARISGVLLEEAGQRQHGGMAAVIGLPLDTLQIICEREGVDVANINSDDQIVISGEARRLARVCKIAQSKGAKMVMQLQVAGALHSSLMAPLKVELEKSLANFQLKTPAIRIIGNTTATPILGVEELRRELASQLARPVLWKQSVDRMVSEGVRGFVEIGPGQVLSGLIRRQVPSLAGVSSGNVESLLTEGADSILRRTEETVLAGVR